MRKWVLLAAALVPAARPAAAQTPPVRVALSGTASPTGGSYTAFSIPVVNASGQVAFAANLAGGTAASGVFTGLPGALVPAALSGGVAFTGGTFVTFDAPILNAAGQVAFTANLAGGVATRGVFVGLPGAVQAAALGGGANTAAPGGGNYSSLSVPVLGAAGRVGFSAGLTGTTSFGGLFAGAPGTVQAAARTGDAAPTPPGGTYNAIPTAPPAINAAGQVAFLAGLSGGASPQGVFVGAPGSVQAAALVGGPTPVAGSTYTQLGAPSVNNAGQVAFRAAATGTTFGGVFVGAPGAVQAAVLSGGAVPGGGVYANQYSEPVVNAAGQVAFLAGVSGAQVYDGVFVGAPGAVQLAARTGAAAPGGGTLSGLQTPVLNAAGQVAFLAIRTGTGITAANDAALYAGAPGNLVRVVGEGDVVDVDPSAGVSNRTVAGTGPAGAGGVLFSGFSGGEDGRPVTLSDTGFVSYGLLFTDGSSGVFVSQIAPVPEPATAGLAAVAALGGLRWLRRRGRTAGRA